MSDFDQFYSEYPRKQGRVAAEKAYEKSLKRSTHAEIMEGLTRFNEHLDENPREKKFIKMPSTWLNQGCYEDEYGPSFNEQMESTAAAVALKERYERDPAYWGARYPAAVLQALNLGPYSGD